MNNNDTLNNFDKILKNKKVDSLLECLLFLSNYYERSSSKESLTIGLPIHNTYMDPMMFKTASKRIGLITKAVKRNLNEIDNLTLPCIIVSNNNESCILLEINQETSKAIVIFPTISMGQINISTDELMNKIETVNNKINILIVKPAYNFSKKITRVIDLKEPKRWFYRTMKENIGIYYLVIISAIFINIFVIFTPIFTMNVYDRVLPNKAIDTLIVLALGIFLIIFFDLILKLLRSYLLEKASLRADIRMSSRIFDQLLNIRLDSKPASTGMFVSRLQSFETVREFFTAATISILVDIPFIILFILVIFYIGGNLAYVSIVSIILVLIFSFFMQKPIKNSILNSTKEDQIKQTTLTETVAGLEIIKGVRGQSRMRTHWENSISQTSYYGNKTIHLSQIVTYVTGFISQLSVVAIVAYGSYLASIGEMTMGGIIAAMMLNSRIIAPVSQIVGMIIKIDRTLISLNNIDEIMNMPVERNENSKYLSRPNLNGDIEFKNIDFKYKDRNFSVLSNINLTIKKGEKVGIIGKVGSGKSTLLKLLLNLYEPNNGSILIDNTDIRQIDNVDLRKSLGYVPQEPFLFMGSIKDNITIGDPYASDDDIIIASKISGVHDIIGKHESGYDLLVGERGEGLSGGERQTVTLARAILSRPEILLLDEPTNSLDELSEAKFKKNLQMIIDNKTLIVVTHKPSILSLVDRIIVLDDGKIIADDKKEKIISMFNDNSNKIRK